MGSGNLALVILGAAAVYYGGVGAVKLTKAGIHGVEHVAHVVFHRTTKHPFGKDNPNEPVKKK